MAPAAISVGLCKKWRVENSHPGGINDSLRLRSDPKGEASRPLRNTGETGMYKHLIDETHVHGGGKAGKQYRVQGSRYLYRFLC